MEEGGIFIILHLSEDSILKYYFKSGYVDVMYPLILSLIVFLAAY